MKGIAHFISGIAAATFIPGVVQAAAQGSYVLALAGACALLPDTLDFKFWRYFEQPDVSIDPGVEIDPQAIAQQVADVINTVYETGKAMRVQLHTIRLGADLWRQYALKFNVERNEVTVRVGPIVNTSQLPYPGSEPQPRREATVKVTPKLHYTYDAESKVDIFSGPSFSFERKGDGVAITFLPWHREWTHSLVVAVGVGLLAGLLVGWLAGWTVGLMAGVCGAVGFATHVLEDQIGAMGSNLFWPFTHKRYAGLNLVRSGDAIPNFLTVWLACAIILFNLDRFSDAPRLGLVYIVYAIIVPAIVLGGVYQYGRRKRVMPIEKVRQMDIVSETQEVEA